ncbi:hypothetical protein D3C79_700270 [compost metagenome]
MHKQEYGTIGFRHTASTGAIRGLLSYRRNLDNRKDVLGSWSHGVERIRLRKYRLLSQLLQHEPPHAISRSPAKAAIGICCIDHIQPQLQLPATRALDGYHHKFGCKR